MRIEHTGSSGLMSIVRYSGLVGKIVGIWYNTFTTQLAPTTNIATGIVIKITESSIILNTKAVIDYHTISSIIELDPGQ